MTIRPKVFEAEKALEVVVFLASALDDPTFHSISKALYCADRKHLERYGRLICGDHYIAMKYGPVPSHIYDMLKTPLGLYADDKAETIGAAFSVSGLRRNVEPKRKANLALLSESELSCLGEAIAEWGRLTFNQRTEISHDAAFEATDPNGVILAEDIAKTLPNAPELLEYLDS
jgi:uncharacterized phage-associated protein